MQPVTIDHNGYKVTTDKSLLQPESIHRWLATESYWSKGISFEKVKNAFDHSFCIGVLLDETQVGYARLITDYSTFAYLADVYVEEPHRGKGLSKKMLEMLLGLNWVRELRRVMLATFDAHSLYHQFGFVQPAYPERLMEINRPDIYGDQTNICR